VAGRGVRSYTVSVNPTDGSCWVADCDHHQVVHLVIAGRLMGQVCERGTTTNIAGATVEARKDGVLEGSTTTAANGIYTIAGLAPGSYVVTPRKDGYVPQTKGNISVVQATTSYANFALDPVRLKGQVKAAGSAANLAGAAVTVYDGSTVKAAATTNATGIYQIGGVAPGTYVVVASKAGYLRQIKATISISAGAITYVNFSLAASGKLRGQVKAAVGGAPIVGATVTASVGGVVRATGVTTGTYGVYEIPSDLPAGTYTLIASKTGYVSQTKPNITVTAGATAYVNFSLASGG